MNNKKICFIGAGSMAEAILSGLLTTKLVKPGQISVTNQANQLRLEELAYNYGIVTNALKKEELISEADVLILAMKPKDLVEALTAIRELTNPQQLIISVVAGISTKHISKLLAHEAPIIRAMPNTSAIVGLSATGLTAGKTAKEEHLAQGILIFEAIGQVAVSSEEDIDAITGVAGSGPAYIYYLVESMLKGAMAVGLEQELARKLILQTLIGAATMLQETGEDPALLREKVTSPNGTTQAGLDTLRSYGFEEAIKACIVQASKRSKELGELFSKED